MHLDLHNVATDFAILGLHKTLGHPLRQFCKCVKIIHFSCEIVFGQLLWPFGDFHLVTLATTALRVPMKLFYCYIKLKQLKLPGKF